MAGPHREDIVSLRPKLTIPDELPRRRGLADRREPRPRRLRRGRARSASNLRDAAGRVPRPGRARRGRRPRAGHGRRARGRPRPLRRHLRQPDRAGAARAPRPHDSVRDRVRRGRRPGRPSASTARSRSRARSTRRSPTSSKSTTCSSRPVFGVPALPASVRRLRHRGHLPPRPDPHLQHVQPLPGARRAVRPVAATACRSASRSSAAPTTTSSVFRAAAAFAAARPWFDDRRHRARPLERSSDMSRIPRSSRCWPAPRGRRRRASRPPRWSRARDGARRQPVAVAPARARSRCGSAGPRSPTTSTPSSAGRTSTYEIWSINYDFLFGFGDDNSADARPGARVPDQGERRHLGRRQGVDDQAAHRRQVVGRPAAHRRRRRLHLQLHRQERDGEHGDHDGRHQGRQGAGDPTSCRSPARRPKADMEHIFLPILPKHVWENVEPQSRRRPAT